ncbi:MAG: PAS domain S-box protein [Sinobacteraceae bacterium]|nr:PAS domain S-box protein [Nevskiaceae bacterium]MCP5466330.1 PAS domain S-box protein [Nevskiaceae bacterium]MCP5471732.1 PAS domain S-box protein [Nevskiaceae bacterium]
MLDAINRVQAVIQFELDGTVIDANENFLQATGYSLDEIRGRHHRMFVSQKYAGSSEYRQFWERLGRGEYIAGRYPRIAKGGGELWLQASYNPILDLNGRPFKVVKYASDITEEVKREEANKRRARLVQALDNVRTNVMVADEDLNIFYLNRNAETLFRDIEADLRKDLPRFEASKLMGANIDVFHKNPAHQRAILAALSKTHESQIHVGGRTLRITANPVRDEEGNRVATVVEWVDRTQEQAIEQEVNQIVAAVVDGRLEQRIAQEGKSGFVLMLSNGINQLVDTVSQVVTEVRQLVDAANQGDLTKRMAVEGKPGLFAAIGNGVNDLTGNLTDIVTQVKAAAGEVAHGANEISQGNADLSQRTEEQASNLEETASSMEEMTSTVKQTADNAAQAKQLATTAREQAEKGGSVVSNAVRAMTEISEASKKIADIIGVIDEIAFQINLLALNAAVEAARAGEQGRGFAVVASEVRSLAGRSATAAKEIKTLIQDSVRKVEEGATLVNESGQTLQQLEGAVKRVNDIVSEVAATCLEQSSGIEQVNTAVMQMDEMTQQNAALVEEVSAASQSMAEQAAALNEMMERYRVPGSQEPHGARAVAHEASRSASSSAAPSTERRTGNRPWSAKRSAKRSATAAAEPARHAAAPAKRAAAGSGCTSRANEDWDAF